MSKFIKIIHGLVMLAVLGFVFYWFEWRPSGIRKECQRYALLSSLKIGDTQTEEQRYKGCLRQHGLEK